MSWGRRVPAAALLGLAAAVALESRTFTVAFPTDPLGPAAFPLVAAGLLALGGLAVLLEGGRPPGDDGRAEPRRVALACAAFVAYALLLPLLGFVTATALAFAALARLFGGRTGPGLAVGVVFSLALFVLFVYGLGLSLPAGPLGL